MKDFILENGVKIPGIGLGTWQSSPEDVYQAVLWALKAGYRHIDTAYNYGNEEAVGRAILDSGIKREEVFVTTKLAAEFKSYDEAMAKFEESNKNLGLGYIDLFLIHAPWPWSDVGKNLMKENVEVWKAFIELQKQGKVKAIGVSNFHAEEIQRLIFETNVKPAVNQIRFFIGNTQEPVTKYCQDNGILIEAYSPMATGNILENEELQKIAKKYNTTSAKICLQYCVQRETIILPKSIHEERIKDNLVLPFTISKEDMDYLNSLKAIGPTRPLRS